MTTAPDVTRKIRQLENDVVPIYEMITAISMTQVRHTNRFAELAATQDEHGTMLAGHTATLAEHGAKLDRIIELLEPR